MVVAESQPPKNSQLLWGDTHLHTNNSFDAFLNGNTSVTLDAAYRFAREEPGPIERLVIWYRERVIREAIDSGNAQKTESIEAPERQLGTRVPQNSQ